MIEKILVTGFEPFDGADSNPSMDAVLALPDTIPNYHLKKMILPVTFSGCFSPLQLAVEEYHPSAVICTGLASGRDKLSLERVAINIADASRPDNAGNRPIDQPISSIGAPAYFSTLPARALCNHLSDSGFPAEISNSAGTYVCNYLMYRILEYISETRIPTIAGFIHIPKPGIGYNAFCWSTSNITEGLRNILDFIGKHIISTGKR